MGDVEVDKNDRPVYPPKIKSTEVVWNPFDDVFPRDLTSIKKKTKDAEKNKEQETKKGDTRGRVKNKSLLSFLGDEEEEEGGGGVKKEGDGEGSNSRDKDKVKIRSSHDVLNDPKLLKQSAYDVERLKEKKMEEDERKNMSKSSLIADKLKKGKKGSTGKEEDDNNNKNDNNNSNIKREREDQDDNREGQNDDDNDRVKRKRSEGEKGRQDEGEGKDDGIERDLDKGDEDEEIVEARRTAPLVGVKREEWWDRPDDELTPAQVRKGRKETKKGSLLFPFCPFPALPLSAPSPPPSYPPF